MSEKTLFNDFYGDHVRWFVGRVESISDPLKMGRVRVRIYGIHSADAKDIKESDLPWANVVAPITHGGTSGKNGTPVGLKPSAQVFGFFLDGKHSQVPLVLGSIPHFEGPNPVTQEFPQAPATPAKVPGQRGYTQTGTQAGGAGGRPYNASSVKFVGGSNAEVAYNYLEEIFRKDFGYPNSKELAAGVVGNMMAESGVNIDPLAYNPAGGGRGANGIIQWRGARLKAMQVFAQANGFRMTENAGGNPVPDLQGQLAFLVYELKTEKWLRFAQWAPRSKTVEAAADNFERYVEISNAEVSKDASLEERLQKVHGLGKRIEYAQGVFNEYNHNTANKSDGEDKTQGGNKKTSTDAAGTKYDEFGDTVESVGYTSADASAVEELRQLNELQGGGDIQNVQLTEGERAYAIRQGYLSGTKNTTTNTRTSGAETVVSKSSGGPS